MLIILEGADGTGKTTFAESIFTQLKKLGYDVEIQHRGVPKDDDLLYESYETSFEDYRPGQNRAIIFDRLHLGELVYGEIYRNGGNLYPSLFRHVEMFLASRGAVLIHTDGDKDEIAARLEKRGEDFLKPEDLEAVLQGYDFLVPETLTHMLTLRIASLHSGEYYDQVNSVITLATVSAGIASVLNDFPTYVGPVAPDVLLVGHQRYVALEGLGAYLPLRGGEGDYLLSALQNPLVDKFGLVDASREPDLEGLWQALNRPRVVALGSDASDTLHFHRIAHGAVPAISVAIAEHGDAEKAKYSELIYREAEF